MRIANAVRLLLLLLLLLPLLCRHRRSCTCRMLSLRGVAGAAGPRSTTRQCPVTAPSLQVRCRRHFARCACMLLSAQKVCMQCTVLQPCKSLGVVLALQLQLEGSALVLSLVCIHAACVPCHGDQHLSASMCVVTG
jgi:hypothetical protein